jgi:uncharacterized protein (TIGR02466 family)
MNINTIFSSFIAHDYLTIDTAKLKKFCYDEQAASAGRHLSNYGGWQSNEYFIDRPELSLLSRELKERISNLLPRLGFRVDFSITNCWININGKNDFNRPHVHGFSTLAGVFYIKAPKDCGRLILRNPIPAHGFCIDEKFISTWNEFNSITWEIEPEVNKLVIWPAWIDHYTLPNLSGEDRISIAFNISIYE